MIWRESRSISNERTISYGQGWEAKKVGEEKKKEG